MRNSCDFTFALGCALKGLFDFVPLFFLDHDDDDDDDDGLVADTPAVGELWPCAWGVIIVVDW